MPLFPDGFGCERCFQASADEAAQARNRLNHEKVLVDESHLMIRLVSCPDCGQAGVKVFTETVDWVDSDDPQAVSLLPITPEEASRLETAGDAFTQDMIEEIDRGRRYLHVDMPKGAETTARWLPGGFWIRPYD